MKLRYVVAQIMPDLIRQEPINIGILLQSEEWIDCKFIQKIPKDWEIPEDVTQDIVHNINHIWKQRLQNKTEILYIPEINRRVKQCNHCSAKYDHHIVYNGMPKCPRCYNYEDFILVEKSE